ncbi:MAG: hypothetical protein GY797_00345 [Deltaproteobacteria bacterium]|nr:hypothetical protein [Deltaproteobacteria bacterium]
MSNDISGPFNKTDSGPPYVYKVSFPDHDALFNGEHWHKILKKHAWELGIPCKSRKTENGYKLAFLKVGDYDRLLEAMEPNIREKVEWANERSEQLYKRYAHLKKEEEKPSPENS